MSSGHQGFTRVVIKGYKSIKACDIKLNDINVLIGSNGAGKSNFVSAFELYENILKQEMNLYASRKGINSLFRMGIKVTDNIKMEFWYSDSWHSFDIVTTEANSLIFRDERFGNIKEPQDFIFNARGGLNESSIKNSIQDINDERSFLTTTPCRVYHFHDTGSTSKIKIEHNLSHCNMLMWDASNLAAFLYRLREHYPDEYSKIVKIVQRIAPYFKDFILEPEEGNKELIFLRWQENGCDIIFNPSQLSDGTLRFVCLATLLLQPRELQPSTIIIDEPELGLHPYAMAIVAELVKKAANKKQVILATQSAEFLDHFEPENIIVVDRTANASEFKRLNSEKLAAWLEDDYSLGELWNKNLFGGRVAR